MAPHRGLSDPADTDDTPSGRISFFSFGMFIIDEIEYLTPQPPTFTTTTTTTTNVSQPPSSSTTKTNLPGGAGLYALLGARLLSPPPYSQSLSWILDAGHDLPPGSPILQSLSRWHTATLFRHDPTRPTTRAWNGYGSSSSSDPDHRAFRYLTPKRRLDVPDLSPAQLASRSWHAVCSPTRVLDILTQLRARAAAAAAVVVWEPIPDLCAPGELRGLHRAVAAGVDVVSPNADELRMFFFAAAARGGGGGGGVDQHALVPAFMGWDTHGNANANRKAVCVVREGRRGSTVYFPRHDDDDDDDDDNDAGGKVWVHLSAYHDGGPGLRGVVDPTGGGNAYLGAYAVVLGYLTPLARGAGGDGVPVVVQRVWRFMAAVLGIGKGDAAAVAATTVVWMATHVVAAVCACVAAGFAIEQTGVPVLGAEDGDHGGANGTGELWNEERVAARVDRYLEREREGLEHQLDQLRRRAGGMSKEDIRVGK